MSVSYRIDKSLGVVFTKQEGVVTYQEVSDHQQALLQDPDFDPSFDQLVDGTKITDTSISGTEFRLISTTNVFGEGSRRAFVAPALPAIYGMYRMGKILRDSESDEMQVFRDIEEARKWLGLVTLPPKTSPG